MTRRVAVAPRPGVRLSRRRRRMVYTVATALWTSGALWLLFHYFLKVQGDFGVQPHPLEAWWLKLHGACAFAALFLGGLLWAAHVRPGLSLRRRRRSGLTIVGAWLVLALTGYLLYYLSDEDWRSGVGIVHWVVGLALAVPLVLHSLRGRRQRLAAPAGND